MGIFSKKLSLADYKDKDAALKKIVDHINSMQEQLEYNNGKLIKRITELEEGETSGS
jgi:hypothetical protein